MMKIEALDHGINQRTKDPILILFPQKNQTLPIPFKKGKPFPFEACDLTILKVFDHSRPLAFWTESGRGAIGEEFSVCVENLPPQEKKSFPSLLESKF
ncbi:MAG: hypothetical protein N3G78_12350 [Desulfobacterota bacterium]|nr:hypothetical protein [Thermodesulfobacteriota bacterium]